VAEVEAPTARYAIYYAPRADDPLWKFGSSVIAYDAAAGLELPGLVPQGWTESTWRAATEEPLRYGFHGTLKAPMRLAQGRDEPDLLNAVAEFARRMPAVNIGVLEVARLRSFVALVPRHNSADLMALAGSVVEAFEPFRAPLTETERQKRLSAGLPPALAANLERYGYPYVMESFRFHMTLSGAVGGQADRLAQNLGRAYSDAGLARPVFVDRLAVFRQDAPGHKFRIIASFALQA